MQISRFTSSKPSEFAFASDEKSIRQPTASLCGVTLDILAAAHAADSLTAPQNEYANNRVVNALVNMALGNKSVYIAEERDTATWAKANIGTTGYLAFTQRDLFTGLPSDIQRKWTLRACQVNDLLNTFCSAPEYGVYFNFNAQEHEYCFLNSDIIIRAWRAVQDGV